MKEQRKRVQEENVRKKEKMKEELKTKCLKGMKVENKDSGFEEVGKGEQGVYTAQTSDTLLYTL